MESEEKNKADLLPDYEIKRDALCFDYRINTTMYPVSMLRAKTLLKIGLKVYEIEKYSTDVKSYRVGKSHKFSYENLYAIRKEDWQEFIETEDGEQFVLLWKQTSEYMRKILCREPVMRWDKLYRQYEDVFWEETAFCKEYLEMNPNREDSGLNSDVDYNFHYEFKYGQILAAEYATKLLMVEKSLDRKDANYLCGYMKIVKMQYDYIIDEFYKAIQQQEEQEEIKR